MNLTQKSININTSNSKYYELMDPNLSEWNQVLITENEATNPDEFIYEGIYDYDGWVCSIY